MVFLLDVERLYHMMDKHNYHQVQLLVYFRSFFRHLQIYLDLVRFHGLVLHLFLLAFLSLLSSFIF
jgi:hypothetical protein